jgi:apolipoprotein N-acyltransferase
LEMIRARLFGGFPWNFIGASQYQLTPLIQIASVTGVHGISFLVVWFSLSFFSAMRAVFSKTASRFAWQPEVFFPLLAVAIIFAFGSIKMHERLPPVSNLRVTLIQPSVPQTLIWNESENASRFRQLLALSESALTNRTDLLIWPESALPEFDEESLTAITNLIRTHRVWMILDADDATWRTNATDKNDFDVFNAAFLFDPNGNCTGIYHKQKLVAFGEYIPLARWLPFLKWFTPIQDGYATGDRPVTFEINRPGESPREPIIELNNGSSATSPRQTVKTSPLICFEDTFPQLAREADKSNHLDFLVNLTNDGWFGRSAEQWQHMANAVFRAIENGVPLIRCANNGVTCWIDSYGSVREILKDQTGGVYGVGAMTVQIPLLSEKPAPTFCNRHGDWFGWSCAMVATVVLLLKFKKILEI